MVSHEQTEIGTAIHQNGSAVEDWPRDTDKEALMPESSLQIEDGLLASLHRSSRKSNVSKFVLTVLSILIGVLALTCALLAAALLQTLKAYQLGTGDLTPFSSTSDNFAAANDALERAVFPISVDLSRQACSNTGVMYTRQNCTCFACFTGSRCQQSIPLDQCVINANAGTPLLFEEYWTQHPVAETRIRASDHIGYLTEGQLPRLEAAIRTLHAMVGNAVIEGKHIIFGPGSSEVIYAALLALGMTNMTSPLPGQSKLVYCAKPYYSAYAMQTNVTQSRLYTWSETKPDASLQPVIEFVTAPNNPDGVFRNKTVPGAMAVFDHAYYWPMYTGIKGPVNYSGSDMAVFTLSKLSGHAGSRIGWAIVEDDALAARMRSLAQQAMSYESQARATVLLEHIIGSQGAILNWAGARMNARWERLESIFNSTTRFSGQALEEPSLDIWTGLTRRPAPAYLWLQCRDSKRDPDCTQTLKDGGLLGRPGSSFGSGPELVRLELLMRQEDFVLMADKLEKLARE